MDSNKKRETFSSPLAIFFATLGSAVGIGNVWKFPYMVGMNGGGAFLLVYVLCIALIGLPIMIAEFYVGRSTRKSPVSALVELSKKYKIVGYFYIFSTYLVLFFYSAVGGWVYLYVFKALSGQFVNLTPEKTAALFNAATVGPFTPVIWQFIVIVVVGIIISLGVKSGIEKMTKTLMPVLFVLLIIVAIRGLTLSGASEGLKFLLLPDFSKITSQGILAAMGLSFFKLSIAMGPIITYASYFTKETNMMKTAVSVAFSDTLISVLAGIAIFPVVFTFGIEPGAGPGLLFMTIPLVFSKIPFGGILLAIFFVLVAIAATGALISLVEVTVADLMERMKFSRQKSVIIASTIIFIFGIFATLSYDPKAIFGAIKEPIFGGSIFNLYDSISSNVLMPIGGLLVALIVGYRVSKDKLYNQVSNEGNLNINGTFKLFLIALKYITPILVILVLVSSLGLFK
ncbi:sodium-dependent transporter [Clostridium cylindrosporum]|uniref:Transporter n=1 Tax=Clostridium cylindrosporum DSM 605 TaxID=1121307 RepID=A0A0J8DDP4_CLOCY|nr:sodium-dependent transporter [Clostridium cylindrosporum]KMT22354.1 Na+-dependent transporter of the SNF family [Clostridium cylindrosporum DSM 605]